MTTEPGPPIDRHRRDAQPTFRAAGHPDTGMPFPLPTRNTDIPEVPAPPNALTMKCSEFNDLDEATRLAVIRAILAEENNTLGPDNEAVAQILGRVGVPVPDRAPR